MFGSVAQRLTSELYSRLHAINRRYEYASGMAGSHIFFPVVEYYKMADAAIVPTRKYPSDAGYDLYTLEDTLLNPRSFTDIHTGICIKMPTDMYWARITGRSSTVRSWGIQIQEGVIDSGYSGEMFVGCWNLTDVAKVVPAKTRLAQLIFHINVHVLWDESPRLLVSERGSNGFGSTGK